MFTNLIHKIVVLSPFFISMQQQSLTSQNQRTWIWAMLTLSTHTSGMLDCCVGNLDSSASTQEIFSRIFCSVQDIRYKIDHSCNLFWVHLSSSVDHRGRKVIIIHVCVDKAIQRFSSSLQFLLSITYLYIIFKQLLFLCSHSWSIRKGSATECMHASYQLILTLPRASYAGVFFIK